MESRRAGEMKTGVDGISCARIPECFIYQFRTRKPNSSIYVEESLLELWFPDTKVMQEFVITGIRRWDCPVGTPRRNALGYKHNNDHAIGVWVACSS